VGGVLVVNVFELDETLLRDYERFARSFTQIRAPDIRVQVEEIYASDRFWPEPLVSINPRLERGVSIDQLAKSGNLHDATARIFSADGKPLSLYRHQSQAVAKAVAGQSFVVTTGTGSGKSLCFFIPIIDAANILGLQFVLLLEPPDERKYPFLRGTRYRPGRIAISYPASTNWLTMSWDDGRSHEALTVQFVQPILPP
jgi:DEAD/DEAH box helicase